MTEKEYRKLNLVSYSSLSKLANSPQAFKAEQTEDSTHMILGSVVDLLLTGSQKEFDEQVYIMTASVPGSVMMLNYCKTLAETGDSTLAYQASEFKISPAAVASKFDKEGKAYYDALIASEGKMIIGAEDMMKANSIVNQLRTNPFTKKYFIPDSSDVELLFQFPIIWKTPFKVLDKEEEWSMMEIKSLLDIVYIDHTNGTITPVDLKTGGEGFMKSYWRFKRYLQASMYTDAVSTHSWRELKYNDNRLDHYITNPLKFVFADTNLFYPPMIYSSTAHDIMFGRNGVPYIVPVAGLVKTLENKEIHQIDSIGFGPSEKIKIKGYQQLIAELDWHQKNDQWDYTYEDYQNTGERQIDAFDVKL